MPETSNNAAERQKKIEAFLLDPEKTIFQTITEFEGAVTALTDILSRVDLDSLDKLQGKDGYTPERGVDYFTEDDLQGIQDFILSKIPKIGVDLPSVKQAEDFVAREVAKIPRIKGDKGDSIKGDPGKDGSPDTGADIVKKIRALGKNQMLRIDDIRGLENVLKRFVTDDQFEELRTLVENQKFVIPANPGGGEGGSGEDATAIHTDGVDEFASITEDTTPAAGDYFIAERASDGVKIKVPYSALVGEGTGDMLASVYDPNEVAGDAFDMDNMVEGTDTKILTAAERAKLANISVTQAVDLDTIETQAAAGAAAKVKTDYISVTQAVDLDALESQAASAASDATAAKTKTDYITVTQAVDLDDIETRVNGLDAAVVLKGSWDASAGTFPGGGTAQAGASYIVSVAGTVNGVAFAVGDRIIAITDNASTSTFAANWFKADYTDQVLSVAGKTGAVTLDAADIAETAGLKILTAAERTKLSNTSGTNTGDETTTTAGALINGATGKTTPVDADFLGIMDSAASNVLKKLSWANLKATLKTYFDTLYQAAGTYLTPSSSSTLTNKTMIDGTNVVEEITTTASSSTPTPTGGSLRNFFTVTALAAGATFAAPSGTPANGNRLVIRVKDNGTARTLAFNAIYRAIGVTLPTTTVINKTLYLGCIYNSADSKWDVIAYAVEA